jgi:hypothetical protein
MSCVVCCAMSIFECLKVRKKLPIPKRNIRRTGILKSQPVLNTNGKLKTVTQQDTKYTKKNNNLLLFKLLNGKYLFFFFKKQILKENIKISNPNTQTLHLLLLKTKVVDLKNKQRNHIQVQL